VACCRIQLWHLTGVTETEKSQHPIHNLNQVPRHNPKKCYITIINNINSERGIKNVCMHDVCLPSRYICNELEIARTWATWLGNNSRSWKHFMVLTWEIMICLKSASFIYYKADLSYFIIIIILFLSSLYGYFIIIILSPLYLNISSLYYCYILAMYHLNSPVRNPVDILLLYFSIIVLLLYFSFAVLSSFHHH
jgi:hypothetical protein